MWKGRNSLSERRCFVRQGWTRFTDDEPSEFPRRRKRRGPKATVELRLLRATHAINKSWVYRPSHSFLLYPTLTLQTLRRAHYLLSQIHLSYNRNIEFQLPS